MGQNFSWVRYTVVKLKQTNEQKDRQTLPYFLPVLLQVLAYTQAMCLVYRSKHAALDNERYCLKI